MVDAKTVTLLDRCTAITVVFFKVAPDTENERVQWHRVGFGRTPHEYTFCYWPGADWCSYDAYRCPDQLTVGNALRYAQEHWERIGNGSVLDMEHIRGEKDAPRTWEDEFGCDLMF